MTVQMYLGSTNAGRLEISKNKPPGTYYGRTSCSNCKETLFYFVPKGVEASYPPGTKCPNCECAVDSKCGGLFDK